MLHVSKARHIKLDSAQEMKARGQLQLPSQSVENIEVVKNRDKKGEFVLEYLI
jgi:hypothetical protein